ncbi:MAG: 1-acyl-sn-glycerol-3-phosphate acyltransferase, partial [bacterium]
FWRNYKRRAQASIGAPIDLKTFLAENAGVADEELSRRMRSLLLAALRAQRRTITGPPIRPRAWFIQEVMGDEALDRAICRLASDTGERADDLRELALRYIREIASDLDYTYAELLERVLGMSLIRLFDSFDIDADGLARTKALFEKGPIVFVPNHRSHVDYLILSYILYHHGMTIPHIAAGANLSFWPLGRIFRRCGAFFIRRSFRDNPLYRDVLTTYLKVLLTEGHCQEFFIEGGRSRTGKLKYPKMGMLRMLVGASHDAGIGNLKFVPVSITYDRVIEHKSYVRESEGEKKEEEKTSHLLGLTKYMRRQKQRLGSIYVRFGEPVAASEDAANPEQIKALAMRICHEINRRTVATPAAVAAASLLCVGRAGITEAEFQRNAQAILACLRSKGVEIPAKLAADPQGVLREAITKLAAQKLAVARVDAIEPFIAVDESRRVPLSFFRNVIVHYMVMSGLIARLIIWYGKQGREPTIDDLARDIVGLKRLLHHEFRFATRSAVRDHVTRAVDFLASQGALSCSEGGRVSSIPSGAWVLEIFGAQVRPFIETMWVAVSFARAKVTSVREGKALIDEMMRAGLDMYMLGRVRFRESVSKQGFENALYALVDYGVLVAGPQKPGTKRQNTYLPSQDPTNAQNLKVELERLL